MVWNTCCELKHENPRKELYGRHEVKDNIIYINDEIAASKWKKHSYTVLRDFL